MSDESAKSVVKPAVSRTDKRAEKFRDAIRRPILEKRYMNARLDGKGMVESAQIAGFEGADLRTPGKRIETPELKRQMQEALLRQGLTLDRIAEKVADAMDATAYATFQGVVTGSDVPDHSVRMKAVEQASKLFGLSEANVVQMRVQRLP